MEGLLHVLVLLSLSTCAMTYVTITNSATGKNCGGAGGPFFGGSGTFGTSNANMFYRKCDWKLTAHSKDIWIRLTFTNLDIGSFHVNYWQNTRVQMVVSAESQASNVFVYRAGLPFGKTCAAWDTTCAKPIWFASSRQNFTVSASTGASNVYPNSNMYLDSKGSVEAFWDGMAASGVTGHTGFTIKWIELKVCAAGNYNSPSGIPACLPCPANTTSLRGSRSIEDCL